MLFNFAIASLACLPVIAQDWSQMLGPNRDGSTNSPEQFSTDWPKECKLSWQIGLGSGFGGAAIVRDQAFTLHRLENQEFLEATNLKDGQKAWRTGWPASYRGSYNPDNGPRCVPTIADSKAICYGAAGDVVCIDIRNGQMLWQRQLRKEYNAEDGYFGAGSSPLVVGDLIVICLGGKQAGVIGLELESGKTRWTATDYEASYASPIAVDGSTAVVVTRLKTILVDLADGKVLSEVAFGSRGTAVNAATPVSVGKDRYLLTASYGVGATLLSVQNRSLSEIFSGSDLLSSQYNTPVVVAKQVIGIHGREDVGVGSLRALDLDREQIVWEVPNFGTAHLIVAGSQVLALSLDGTLTLLDGSASKFQPLAQCRLPAGTYRAPPALSNGRLVARNNDDNSGRSQLVCVELPVKQP